MTALEPVLVTFTGVDDETSHESMARLSEAHALEWGILFHPERQGEGRFPALPTIEALLETGLAFSAHLCGRYAVNVIKGEPLPGEVVALLGRFRRIQVNTAARGFGPERIARFADRFGARGILQCRGLDEFPQSTAVDWLFDRSGGRGELAARWPVPRVAGVLVGYAGGLGPDTIADAIQAICASRTIDAPYWLDMEGAIRTDDRFDLEKCRRVCEIAFAAKSAL